ENVEKEFATSALEEAVNPLEARAEDRLAGGFVVKKRLGTGSTSVALLVQRDGQEGVLKVALDPSLNMRVVCLASHRLLAGESPAVVSARAPRSRLPVLLGDRGC